MPPVRAGGMWESQPGPWIYAGHEGPSSCCGWIEEGDEIRADGNGGWEHRDCIEREPRPTRFTGTSDDEMGF